MKRSVTVEIETEDDAKDCSSYHDKITCPWLNGKCELFNAWLRENMAGKVRRCKACLKADTMPDSPKLK